MYAYLRVETRDFDLVRLPDGTDLRVGRGSGKRKAAEWRAAQAEAARDTDSERVEQQARAKAFEEAQVAQAARVAKWQEQLDRALEDASTITAMRAIREDFAARRPEPPVDPIDGRPVELADALGIPVPEVIPERRWIAALAEIEPRAEFVLGPDGPYPRPAVAKALSELENSGWSVVHVSEERAVSHEDGGARAYTVAAWILLHSRG
jgi:hypothetical protein